MKKNLFAFLVAVFFVSQVSAVTIDFDSMTIGSIDGVDIGGVILTSNTSNDASIINGDATGFGYISPYYTASTWDYLTSSDLTFTFTDAVDSVSFYAGDAGGDTDRFWVDVYAADSTFLGTVDTGVFGGNPLSSDNYMVDAYFVDLSSYGEIGSFVVRDAINAGILIDDLSFSEAPPPKIPEPSTILLIALALIGFVAFKRKK